jgi:hypothetical protein
LIVKSSALTTTRRPASVPVPVTALAGVKADSAPSSS